MLKKIFFLLFILLVLIGTLLELNNLLGGTPYNRVIAIGYFTAFFYTVLFGFILKKLLQKIISKISLTLAFTAVGTFGSIVIETVVWAGQESLHATGAAISTNLLLDLIMTVPFYTLLAFLFSKQILKSNYSWQAIAIVGGCYEILADGIIGNLFQLNLLGALISPIFLPIFIVTYSPIILVPFLILAKNNAPLDNKYILLLQPTKAAFILPFSIGLGLLLKQII